MILVFGQNGQVGTEIARLDPDIKIMGRDKVDLAQPDACADVIFDVAPRAVINAAAYTAVDRAESEEDLALAVNGVAPAQMARACASLSIPLIHISTDYVFDGAGELPFKPDHPTKPLGAYGRTKLLGEHGVRKAGGKYIILRTSWVFSAHGINFVKTMLRLGAERDELKVVADQIGGPTPARAIAQACLVMAQQLESSPEKSGTYHFSGAPDASWAEFARLIMAQAGLKCHISDIETVDYPTVAKRPLNSRLNCATLSEFGLQQPDWRLELEDVLHELRMQ